MEKADALAVEVAYGRADRQWVIALDVPLGTTVEQAVRLSGLLDACPEIDLAQARVGVFGKLAKPDRVLADGDRVEVYRPLLGDPKEIRRRLAAEGKTMGRKGGS